MLSVEIKCGGRRAIRGCYCSLFPHLHRILNPKTRYPKKGVGPRIRPVLGWAHDVKTEAVDILVQEYLACLWAPSVYLNQNP